MGIDRTHILVLNYNGLELLKECLPSVVRAAGLSAVRCPVTVVDNGSTDSSIAYLEREWPDVGIMREPNRGLASFNHVLARLDEPAVLLLNNDVKLDEDAVRPLIAALDRNDDAIFAAPKCWNFDGTQYEGMRTRVRSRYGLVQGLCRVPGHEATIDTADLTASAGPVLAVHRERFLALGGYDPLYFPGRIEDLDLGFRAWMAGWRGYYVPESLAFHQGMGSFEPAFGRRGCDRLATRNTLLFAWKNLRGTRLAAHLVWLAVRLLYSFGSGRLGFLLSTGDAVVRLGDGAEGPAARQRNATGLGSSTRSVLPSVPVLNSRVRVPVSTGTHLGQLRRKEAPP